LLSALLLSKTAEGQNENRVNRDGTENVYHDKYIYVIDASTLEVVDSLYFKDAMRENYEKEDAQKAKQLNDDILDMMKEELKAKKPE